MMIDELSELKRLVEGLEVIIKSGMEMSIEIRQIKIIERAIVSIGNINHKFEIILDSDGIENLMGNAKRIKVTK